MSEHFNPCARRDGLVYDFPTDRFRSKMFAWGFTPGAPADQLLLEGAEGNAYYGFVYSGIANLKAYGVGDYALRRGMYFAVSGRFAITGGSGIVICDHGPLQPAVNGEASPRGSCVFQIGGPIEKFGRLRYIDGCTDSLLIAPWLKGLPCLNHLHFPRRIDQTEHTHPSFRLGIIVAGAGKCRTPDGVFDLTPGGFWCIPEGGVHAFMTDDSTMDVIAYHPDSDFGPEHENHPMVNRTLVEGVPSSQIPRIQTTAEQAQSARQV